MTNEERTTKAPQEDAQKPKNVLKKRGRPKKKVEPPRKPKRIMYVSHDEHEHLGRKW